MQEDRCTDERTRRRAGKVQKLIMSDTPLRGLLLLVLIHDFLYHTYEIMTLQLHHIVRSSEAGRLEREHGATFSGTTQGHALTETQGRNTRSYERPYTPLLTLGR